ncbi:MAG: YceD family protein [Xanthomonadaceae bacterium]|nr:YceD family protein [Xanthomonadaceae bacterium]
MSRDFPDWFDAERTAQAERHFAGEMRLEWMPRVLDLLDSPEPTDEIGFELQAGRDEQNTVCLNVRVHGTVPMTCQRTLKRYWQPIESCSTVAIVASEREADELPENLEPRLAAQGNVRTVELIEDELLLALPLVPRDPNSEPVGEVEKAVDEATETGRQNPFAELAALRKRH